MHPIFQHNIQCIFEPAQVDEGEPPAYPSGTTYSSAADLCGFGSKHRAIAITAHGNIKWIFTGFCSNDNIGSYFHRELPGDKQSYKRYRGKEVYAAN